MLETYLRDAEQNGEPEEKSLVRYIRELQAEITCLKAGKFTPEELDNLCHNLSEDDYKAFCDGCDAYQRQLFGKCRSQEITINRVFERPKAKLLEVTIANARLVEESVERLLDSFPETVSVLLLRRGKEDWACEIWDLESMNQASFKEAKTPQEAIRLAREEVV